MEGGNHRIAHLDHDSWEAQVRGRDPLLSARAGDRAAACLATE